MTLAELKQDLALYLGLDTTIADGLVALWDARLLNNAAKDLALTLKIPRGDVLFSRADLEAGPVSLPNNAAEVLRVVATPDYVLPILEADDYTPGTDEKPALLKQYSYVALVQGTAPITLTLLAPDMVQPPEAVKVTYRASFADMAQETDQPWGGAYPEWHRIIPLRAAMDALMFLSPGSEGENEVVLRINRAREKYEAMLQEFRKTLDKVMYLARADLRSGMYNRGGHYA